MPVIPHAYSLFDSAGLLLHQDALSFSADSSDWQMGVPEATRHIGEIGRFVAEDRRRDSSAFASPLLVSLIGAEPLQQLSELDELLTALASFGLAAEVWTSASWVQSAAHARETFAQLSGRVHALRLQTTSELLDEARLHQIELLMEAARSAGVLVDVHCGIAPDVPFARELLSLEVVNNGTSFVHVDPDYDRLDVADRDADRSGLFMLSAPSRQRCAEKFGFYVAPGGAVYPCLAGVGQEALCIGDLGAQTMDEVVANARQDASLMRLREHGPAAIAGDEPPGTGTGDRWVDNCDFHRQILASARSAPALGSL